MKSYIIIFLLLAITFLPSASAEKTDYGNVYANEGYVAFVVNETPTKPLDKDKEEAKCECGGTGVITHGDGHKTPCPCGKECKCGKPDPAPPTPTPPAPKPKSRKRMLYFTASWCGPCQWFKKNEIPKLSNKNMDSSLIDDDKETKMEIVDIDEHEDLFNKYRNGRSSIPLFVLLDENDKEVSSLIGAHPYDKILEMWNAN